MTDEPEKTSEPPQVLYAFWKYDQYPYCLGGVIDKWDDDGRVRIARYSGWFKPVLVTTYARGMIIQQDLDRLATSRKSNLEAIEAGFEERLKNSVPDLYKAVKSR